MLYRSDKYGNQISQLGYGCMRFTRKGSSLDYEKAEKELLLAIDRGINYLDSAYIYIREVKSLWDGSLPKIIAGTR